MEQRNLLLAIVLSVGILIGFQFLIEHFHLAKPPAPPTTAPGTTAQGTPPGVGAPSEPGIVGPQATPGAPQSSSILTRETAIAEQPRIRINTPRLHGSIALRGGRIDDLTLASYHEAPNPASPEVVLLQPSGTGHAYFAEFGWVAGTPGAAVPGPETSWAASGGRLTPASPITLTWDNGQGLVFTRRISVDENYMFTVRDAVRNSTATPVTVSPYALITRTGTPEVGGYFILHEGPVGYLAGSLREYGYTSIEPANPKEYNSTGGWLGFTDKYWLTSIVPPQDVTVKARFIHRIEGGVSRYQTDFLSPPITVPGEGTAVTEVRFFGGAKEVNLLDAYAESGIPHFDLAIDFGWFYFLTKPIFLVLQWFYGLLGNFGLAILLLTLIIKILFFPLANKSYQAMSKMKLLQPEMQKIRERFPDDKARQQQEMMEMYKRVGANPVAGCLPIIIQIPVFFALYKVLFVTIEMRHAPFFGWIHDLSAPDPTTIVNLFGLIPYTPPHFLMIGAWPLIMGVTMFLQQKLNPQPVDPVQARMFMLLPVVFTYMLAAFPAGLVIYWAWNNLLSIAQQWAIMHRAGAA
jgi:YidC/Oxa1 family membrane protein insertase